MKAKIANLLCRNAIPTMRFWTLMVLIFFLFLNGLTFSQNGRYDLGYNAYKDVFTDGLIIGNSPEFEIGKTPFQCQTKDSRNQYLYYGSELLGLSATAGNITSLAFNIISFPSPYNAVNSKMYNVTIGLKLTSKANLTGFMESTVVYYSVPELAISSTGWVSFDLTSVAGHSSGFYWPGNIAINNIIVEICQNSYSKASYPRGGSDPYNFEVQSSTFSGAYVNTNYFTSDYFDNAPIGFHGATDGCAMDLVTAGAPPVPGPATPDILTAETATTVAANEVRPDIRFTFACVGAPVSGITNVNPTVAIKKCIGDINILEVPDGDFHSGLNYQWQSSVDGITFNDIFGATSESYSAVKADVDMWYRRKSGCGGSDVPSGKLFIQQKTWNGTAWKTSTDLVPTGSDAPTTNESAVIAGNYTLPGNLTFCSMIVKSGVVTVPASLPNPKILTLTNDLKVIGGSLTFENNTSLIQKNAAAINSGNVTFKRDTQKVRRYDYTYWSSPVQNQNVGAFSPITRPDKYYSWNHIAQDWDFAPPLTTMTSGKGYIIRAPDTFAIAGAGVVWPGAFTGVPTNGDITVQISGTTTPGVEKWNLIGNPFPNTLDVINFYTDNSSLIDGTFYFWTHNSTPNNTTYTGPYTYNYNTNDYASFNKTGASSWSGTKAGVPDPLEIGFSLNNNIPKKDVALGQSFMVKGKVNGVSNVIFKNARRLSVNPPNFFKSTKNTDDIDNEEEINDEDENKSRVWLEYVNDNGGFKQLLVGYLDGPTIDFDSGYDGDIMQGEEVTFFSIIDGHQLGIQGKGLPFVNTDTIKLGFTATVPGNNTIALVGYDGLFENQDVYLEDTYLNVIHNLKLSNYTFAAIKGTFLDRFVLRYTENALNLQPNTVTTNKIVAFNKSGNLVVNSGNIKINTIEVYDLSGRLVIQKNDCDSTNLVFEKPNWNAQLMLVKIVTYDNVSVTKKVLF